MAKIVRKLQKIFGLNAIPTELGVFGSLAAGSAATSTDPVTIQSLSNWLDGWNAAVLGGNSPAIEDMNGMCYVFAYQLAYLMQAGIAEWDATTTYYIGSLVNSAGVVYVSQTNNNLNNAVTDVVNWKTQNGAASVYDAVVGSAAQVTAGRATHSTWASAIAAVAAGSRICILSGSWTENVTLTKRLKIEGAGYDSFLNGTFTAASSSDSSTLEDFRTAGLITINTGVSYVSMIGCRSAVDVVDNGTGSYVQGFTQ